jgi:hypothetical protein
MRYADDWVLIEDRVELVLLVQSPSRRDTNTCSIVEEEKRLVSSVKPFLLGFYLVLLLLVLQTHREREKEKERK